jgi:hypothetical protein
MYAGDNRNVLDTFKVAETGQIWIAVLILNPKYKLFITVVLYKKSIF